MATKNVTVADGSVTEEIPATTQGDLAFKIIAGGSREWWRGGGRGER